MVPRPVNSNAKALKMKQNIVGMSLTYGGLALGVALVAIMAWLERRPRKSLESKIGAHHAAHVPGRLHLPCGRDSHRQYLRNSYRAALGHVESGIGLAQQAFLHLAHGIAGKLRNGDDSLRHLELGQPLLKLGNHPALIKR